MLLTDGIFVVFNLLACAALAYLQLKGGQVRSNRIAAAGVIILALLSLSDLIGEFPGHSFVLGYAMPLLWILFLAVVLHYSIMVSGMESWALGSRFKMAAMYLLPVLFAVLMPATQIFDERRMAGGIRFLFTIKFGVWAYLLYVLLYAFLIFGFFFSQYMKASNPEQRGRCEAVLLSLAAVFFYVFFRDLVDLFFYQYFPRNPAFTFMLITLLYGYFKYKLFRTESLV
ncbi:MAG TPA: hypothetical protein VMD02_03325 [Candidatus Omnitrophota bacterium]|nr:hypothetical protein [Candidatus Omnitrophota bacterium]